MYFYNQINGSKLEHASNAAYLSTIIKKDADEIQKFENP